MNRCVDKHFPSLVGELDNCEEVPDTKPKAHLDNQYENTEGQLRRGWEFGEPRGENKLLDMQEKAQPHLKAGLG